MRYPKTHKQQSRRRILQTAAEQFNQRGVDGIGIAEILKQAGLTQGAFSGHFSSKEELVRECLSEGFHHGYYETPEWAGKPLSALVKNYLSPAHRDCPRTGCPTGTLIGEMARQPRRTRELFTANCASFLDSIESRVSKKQSKPQRRQTARAILALLVGTLQLARVTKGTPLSDEMLAAGIKAALTLSDS